MNEGFFSSTPFRTSIPNLCSHYYYLNTFIPISVQSLPRSGIRFEISSVFKLRERPINILFIRTHDVFVERPLTVSWFHRSRRYFNYLLPFALYLVSLRPAWHAPFIRTVGQTCEILALFFQARLEGKNIGSSSPGKKSPRSRPAPPPLKGFLINS